MTVGHGSGGAAGHEVVNLSVAGTFDGAAAGTFNDALIRFIWRFNLFALLLWTYTG
jgi:hypothetical protein